MGATGPLAFAKHPQSPHPHLHPHLVVLAASAQAATHWGEDKVATSRPASPTEEGCNVPGLR